MTRSARIAWLIILLTATTAAVAAKIKELLTQKKISQLLTAWLQDLRAGSEIRAETLAGGSRGRSQ